MSQTIQVGKYMRAEPVGTAPHESYLVTTRGGAFLATVEWYARWREYTANPDRGVVFSAGCLRDLMGFLENCNKAQTILDAKTAAQKKQAQP